MEAEIQKIIEGARLAIAQADSKSIVAIAAKFIGRKGSLTEILKSLGGLSIEEKKSIGELANRAKAEIEMIVKEREDLLNLAQQKQLMQRDTTLPGIKPTMGHLSPLTIVGREWTSALTELGFEIAEGPEVELELYNFDMLNLPPDHPARDQWDTFWVKKGKDSKTSTLLRTQTSPVQIRYMLEHRPPIRMICPGRTFRYEAEDGTHLSVFSQTEGLMVDKGISVTHMKGVISHFVKKILGEECKARFRPSFFPFTEPSFEVDVWFNGKWLELMGCGMVHPQVLRNVNIDPNEYSGFAFGGGIERLAMLKYGINDIRLFLSGDPRFAEQF
ncbi:MAG: phenylalanine--tRNA ligase subunit alpha [Patescibacteria group bacterium]